MGYAENRRSYWRGRYKIAPGRYGTVADETGATMRFRNKRDAKKAADAEEAKVHAGRWRDPAAGQITFGVYASQWYAAQDLAASTMQNYRHHLEEHLLPEFGDRPLATILSSDVDAWEKKEKALYAASSVRTWRGTLHLVLADALGDGLIRANPATKRRGRGKRAGRARSRGPEKVVTNPLGMLLLAERAALLSGRDDEFVAFILKAYTGMRWGEVVGLETEFVRTTPFVWSGSSTNSTRAASFVAPRRMTAIAPSTLPTGCRPLSRATLRRSNQRRARATTEPTCSADKVCPDSGGLARSLSTLLAGLASQLGRCPMS